MPLSRIALAFALLTFALHSTTLHAEVKTTIDHNAQGSGDFKFKSVPAPSKTDAGNKAKLSIVGGRRDGNGGDVKVLTDSKLPQGDDEPGASLFFAQGSEGGRLLVELAEATEIKQVNTYSWHSGTRGPQVYKLYGINPDKALPRLRADTDLAKEGWTLIASVDSRPEGKPTGGQYGVSIADSDAKPLGTFRYLLFDISRTESDDPFGNTFYSEIDIVDGKTHERPATPKGPDPEVVKIDDKHEVTLDYSQMPELKDWVTTKLKPVVIKWYPLIVEMFPSEGFTAPTKFSITFLPDANGVAWASGNRISCAGPWFSKNLEGEAVGAVVHEMVHVVQQYGGRRRGGGKPNPGWMVEGIPDYVRWCMYEPERLRPKVNPDRAKYSDSYRTTGAFLFFVANEHGKDVIKKFNTAMREGKYDETLWKEYTGKTVDELWLDFTRAIRAGKA